MRSSISRAAVLVPLLAAVAALGDVRAAAGDPPAAASSYYLGRGDPRACPSPICGGVWVQLVNAAGTPCVEGGVSGRECYVAEIDVTSLAVSEDARSRLAGLVASGRALARGTLVRGRVEGFPKLATLVATEVWAASSSPRTPEGPFRLLRDNGIRCVTTPCFSTHAALLNDGRHVNVSRVGLGGVNVPVAERRRALRRLATVGLIGTGRIVREPNAGPGGAGRAFVASQFYVKVTPER